MTIILVEGKCWNFPHSISRDGYGRIRIKYKLRKMSHVVWELSKGKIPFGMCVCHTCDNRLCVRPSHLFLGTQKDNIDDMIRKKRHGIGSRNGRAILNESQAFKIRRSKEPTEKLMKQFHCSRTTINAIRRKEIWRHV